MAGMREIDERMFSILSNGDVEGLAKILAEGADPNATDDGEPALFAATVEPDMVKLLLDAGADVHARTEGWRYTEFFDDLSFVECICIHYESCVDESLDYSDDDFTMDLVHALNAGAAPFVRWGEVPEIFAGLLASHAAADALEATTPEAAAPASARRI